MASRDPNTAPDPRESARRVRAEMWWVGALAVLIASLFALEKWALPLPSVYNFSNNVVFFALINLNVILICVMLFLVLRNVAKLLFERRTGILGARLRTKLIVAFTGFALLPTVMMFFVAASFVTRSINNWFSVQIEMSLRETLEVAQTYYSTYKTSSKFFAKQVAREIQEGEHLVAAAPVRDIFAAEELASWLAAKKTEYNVDGIEVYRAGDDRPIATTAPDEPWNALRRPPSGVEEFMLKALAGETNADIFQTEQGETVRGVTPIFGDGRAIGAVVVTYKVPNRVLKKMTAIRKTYEDYRRLVLLKGPVMSSYFVFFALITLFIFFAATWFGFFLARGIAVPISRLAEATEHVAAGDLDVRIEPAGNDELNRLIASFNRMIGDLRQSREIAAAANEELRAANLEADRRRQYIETVLSNISAGVVSFGVDGRIATINTRAREILGLAGNAVGRFYDDAFGELLGRVQIDELRQSVRDEIAGPPGSHVEREVEIQIGDEQRTLIVRLSVVRSTHTGEPLSVVMVLDDLSELIRAKRVAEWREIARRIAHEIKNPLTPIQLAAQRLRKRYAARFDEETDKAFFDSTAMIIRQVGEMKRLVREFSDFARLAEVLPQPHQLGDIISETLVMYSEAHPEIRFTFTPAPDVPMLLVDRSQIQRVFINLFDNAIDPSVGAGRVEISMRVDDEADEVVVYVDDNGAGLPAAYRQRLFEPYFSTKKMGTGLGLAIVHRIMTDHDARIELRDRDGRGTRVVLAFPLSLAVAAQGA